MFTHFTFYQFKMIDKRKPAKKEELFCVKPSELGTMQKTIAIRLVT